MANKEGKKTGGRTAGTPNKRSLDIMAKAEELGVCPFEFMARTIKGDAAWLKDVPEMDHRVACAKELAQYLAPKRKAVEHSFNPAELPDDELIEKTQKLLNAAIKVVE